jgi:hypothetical protein
LLKSIKNLSYDSLLATDGARTTVFEESGVLGFEPSKLADEAGNPEPITAVAVEGGEIIPAGLCKLIAVNGKPTGDPVPCMSNGRFDDTTGCIIGCIVGCIIGCIVGCIIDCIVGCIIGVIICCIMG